MKGLWDAALHFSLRNTSICNNLVSRGINTARDNLGNFELSSCKIPRKKPCCYFTYNGIRNSPLTLLVPSVALLSQRMCLPFKNFSNVKHSQSFAIDSVFSLYLMCRSTAANMTRRQSGSYSDLLTSAKHFDSTSSSCSAWYVNNLGNWGYSPCFLTS